jgi:hypothetical protein
MNFLEAVQALEDGRCEGILHTNWVQKLAPQFLVIEKNNLTWSGGHEFLGFCVSQMLTNDWQLVNPIPQTETVEVKRFVNLLTGDCRQPHMMDGLKDANRWVELTGTYERPVPAKVKHREEIIPRCGDYQVKTSREYRSFTGTERIFREWEEEVKP